MKLIPAIDMKNGQCVRLLQGAMNEVTVFDENPVKMADSWVEQGAERLHLVDLDGAVRGKPCHLPVLKKIRARHRNVALQFGGGVRHIQDIDLIAAAGADQVIVATLALQQPRALSDYLKSSADQIILSIDNKDGRPQAQGWTQSSEIGIIELVDRMRTAGLKRLFHTDVNRDGMELGIDLEKCRFLSRWGASLNITVAGGLGTMAHVAQAAKLQSLGVDSIVAGRALYNGSVDFVQAKQILAQPC